DSRGTVAASHLSAQSWRRGYPTRAPARPLWPIRSLAQFRRVPGPKWPSAHGGMVAIQPGRTLLAMPVLTDDPPRLARLAGAARHALAALALAAGGVQAAPAAPRTSGTGSRRARAERVG